MSKRGLFITFEGPEGSGKSTHSKLLCDFLREKKFKVLHTREPGGTAVSEKIRRILLDPKNRDMDTLCEMFLYMASRAQIVRQKILPALKEGKIVVCDRFLDATVVYQGYAGGIDVEAIKDIGKIATGGRLPDITFLLDINAKRGLDRRGKTRDRMEQKSLLYHKRVRKGYLSIARHHHRRIKILSSLGDIAETQKIIRKIVLKRICHSKI